MICYQRFACLCRLLFYEVVDTSRHPFHLQAITIRRYNVVGGVGIDKVTTSVLLLPIQVLCFLLFLLINHSSPQVSLGKVRYLTLVLGCLLLLTHMQCYLPSLLTNNSLAIPLPHEKNPFI